MRLNREGTLQIVRVRDDETTVLAETGFDLGLETPMNVAASVRGDRIVATVDGVSISARDDAFRNGGIGLVVHEGALSTDVITVTG